MREISALIALILLSSVPAFASQQLDMRFHHEGRTYHKIADIAVGTDLDLQVPVASDDKSKTVILKLRASLKDADAFGRKTLLYKMSLTGAGDALLLESSAAVYLRSGTYSTIVECGGWDMSLGTDWKTKSGLRTNDDEIVVTAKSARGDQKCKMHIKPGTSGS